MSEAPDPAEPAMVEVGVAYATPGRHAWIDVTVPAGSTIRDAIAASGILQRFPEIDLKIQKVGMFGKMATLSAPVEDGARIEIYRAITADPKAVKRKRPEKDDGGDGE